MKEKITILNVLCYEKDNKKGTRLGFVFSSENKLSNNDKYKGFSEISCFYEGDKVFNSIPLDMIGVPVDVTLKSVADFKNPLNTRNIIDTISYKGNVINLL